MNERLRKIVFAAVFAALTCAATMLIQIPTLTKGYVNLGDCFVLLAGWLCGAPWGAAAAGIGSALADIASGYAVYAPASFVIKAGMAVIAALAAHTLKNHISVSRMIGAVCAELFMSAGYFVFEGAFVTGSFETAVIGIPENLIQGVFGVLSSVAVITALEKTKAFRRR